MSERHSVWWIRWAAGMAAGAMSFLVGMAAGSQPPAPPAPLAPAAGDARNVQLMEGVKEIAAPGTPGVLSVWGPDAIIIAAGKQDRELLSPVVAAGTRGRGRLVAFPHTGLLSEDSMKIADTGRLIENAVRWASRKQAGAPIKVGVLNSNLAAFLGERGFTAREIKKEDVSDAGLAAFDVVCIVGHDFDDSQTKSLARFVEVGGGLLAAQTAWAWKAPEGKSLTDNPLNILFGPAGIVWTGGYSGKTGEIGFSTSSATDPMLHAAHSFDAIVAAGKIDGKPDARLRLAAHTALEAVRALPANDSLLRPRVEQLMRENATRLSPSEKEPLTTKEPLARLLLAAQVEQIRTLPVKSVRPHGASTAFPGPVPATAPRISRTVSIDPSVADWQSTGLYAAPGEVVIVTIPAASTKDGLRVRIGCHKDQLWNAESWKRVPEITRDFVLNSPRTEAVCAFGGPIYIDVDKRADGAPIEVTIDNAVEAPLYVLGQTTIEDWKSKVRSLPAPWAELVGKKIIVSVPSSAVRTLDDPESLMKFWDSIADAEDELATVANLDRHHRPERYVADVQISAGYMHSGYPIMTHLDAADNMTQVEKLRKGSWGLFHELGHNHQGGDWTFDGTVEVTCNLFSMYVLEKACGLPWRDGHAGLKNPDEKIGKYLATGANFDEWKSDPFLALQMYAQLVEGFGWEAFKQVFAEYRSLGKDAKPKSDDEKRDQWMVRFSRACGKNLGPFFQTWGVPTTAAARDSIKDLPEWLPPGFPPQP